MARTSVLFVCAANICRSPLAMALFRHLSLARGLEPALSADSRGFRPDLEGSPFHPQIEALCLQHGVRLEGASAPFQYEDFSRYDLIVAMDRDNIEELQALDRDWTFAYKVHLLGEFASNDGDDLETFDPIGGTLEDFCTCYELILDRVEGLLAWIGTMPPS